jgi:hypothetical protein
MSTVSFPKFDPQVITGLKERYTKLQNSFNTGEVNSLATTLVNAIGSQFINQLTTQLQAGYGSLPTASQPFQYRVSLDFTTNVEIVKEAVALLKDSGDMILFPIYNGWVENYSQNTAQFIPSLNAQLLNAQVAKLYQPIIARLTQEFNGVFKPEKGKPSMTWTVEQIQIPDKNGTVKGIQIKASVAGEKLSLKHSLQAKAGSLGRREWGLLGCCIVVIGVVSTIFAKSLKISKAFS